MSVNDATCEDRLTLLERRELEARVVGPLVRGFIEAFGPEPSLAVVRGVIRDLAREAGAELASRVGEASLTAFASCLDAWRAGGALEIEMIEADDERLSFNVTRCRFAEMYRALGLADLGASLSCERDFAVIQGFNPKFTLERSQTIMEGATHCDFRFRKSCGTSDGGGGACGD